METCRTCKEPKPLSEFYVFSKGPNRRQRCLDCKDCYNKNQYAAKKARGNRTTDLITVEGRRIQNLKRNYNLTLEQVEEMCVLQGNRCLICKSEFEKTPHIDHNHLTHKVRGLLCGSCNHGLGNFKDSIELLRAAIAYLEQTE